MHILKYHTIGIHRIQTQVLSTQLSTLNHLS